MPVESASTRPVLGTPKAGLRVSVEVSAQRLAYRGRANPALLYLVLGTALGVGLVGSLVLSPESGLLGTLAFSVLLSPVILFVIYGALRLRSSCEVDRPAGCVRVDERAYASGYRVEFDLAEATEVRLAVKADTPLVGTAARYGVYLRFTQGYYQVLASSSERQALTEAERLAIFMGLPLVRAMPPQAPDGGEARAPVPWRTWLTMLLVYAAPVGLAALGLLVVFRDVPPQQRVLITALGAIMLSQVGAILAFAYYRARSPRDGH